MRFNGLSYNKKEEVVEIFNEYMHKANKITSYCNGVLYDDGTYEGE